MTLSSWERRKTVLLYKIELVIDRYSHRRGRKPRDLSYWELLLDSPEARKLPVQTFLQVESRVNDFWLS